MSDDYAALYFGVTFPDTAVRTALPPKTICIAGRGQPGHEPAENAKHCPRCGSPTSRGVVQYVLTAFGRTLNDLAIGGSSKLEPVNGVTLFWFSADSRTFLGYRLASVYGDDAIALDKEAASTDNRKYAAIWSLLPPDLADTRTQLLLTGEYRDNFEEEGDE